MRSVVAWGRDALCSAGCMQPSQLGGVVALPRALPKGPPQEFHPFALHLLSQRLALLNVQACKE